MEKNSALPAIALAKAGQKGQALLIVLLVMVVGLTIGLSLSSRSVTDIKISTQLEESSRAFSAAEAGIEVALKGEAAPTSPVQVGNATYIFSTTTAGGTTDPFKIGEIGIADTYTVWLVEHSGDALDLTRHYGERLDSRTWFIDVCWQKAEGTTEPAMEITLIYKDTAGNYRTSRGAYDPDSGRRTNNNFTATDSLTCGGIFSYGKIISLPMGMPVFGTPVALRLRPFYAKASVAVAPRGGATLPSQGISITSTGTAGETTRKVVVTQSYPSLPAIFDYVLFSGTGVSK